MDVPWIELFMSVRRDHTARLPKRPKHIESPKAVAHTYYPKTTVYKKDVNRKGNLENSEYRFWGGALFETSPYCQCRCCSKIILSYDVGRSGKTVAQLRKEHMADTGCTKELVAAFKVLLAAKSCVVCGKSTKKQKWGVPICDAECEYSWKFDIAKPVPLRTALSQILIAELSAGVKDDDEKVHDGVAKTPRMVMAIGAPPVSREGSD